MPESAAAGPESRLSAPLATINLLAFENDVGNSRDLVVLGAALGAAGCEVTVTRISKHARRRRKLGVIRRFGVARRSLARAAAARGRPAAFDVNVMLEHGWPEQLHRARRNVIVPNPEFFDRHDQSLLGAFDRVWAKTRRTEQIFTALGAPVSHCGFDSDDRFLPDVAREPAFLHLAGKSRMKGTARLVALWARHPEWPLLTVVQSLATGATRPVAANIAYETRFLSDLELRVLQNRHAFHLCTSETEGWGHYIVEAQSTGAIVLATDAPPMNELVARDRGELIGGEACGRQNLATLTAFDLRDCERAVATVLGLEPAERRRRGEAARAWFDSNKRAFPSRLAAVLATL